MSVLRRNVSCELDYVQLCEDFISTLVSSIIDGGVIDIPLIEFAMNIEQEVYNKTMEDNGIDGSSELWRLSSGMEAYIALADKVLG